MPPRRPHPRSLDALFPKPKKVAIKRCVMGHRQGPSWKPEKGCTTCMVAERTRKENEAYRNAPLWPGGRVPAYLTTKITSTGKVITHSIPGHLAAQRRAADKARRRPRRGRRI